jgi:hypothetical protein
LHGRDIAYEAFDYHAIVRAPNKPMNMFQLLDKVGGDINEYGFFVFDGATVVR